MSNGNEEVRDDELDQFEKQVLSNLQPENEDPVLDEQAETPPASTSEPTAPTPQKASNEPPPATEPEPQGDVRAALRASRRSERQAREHAQRLEQEREQLQQQLAELRGDKPAADPNADPDLSALEVDVPVAAAVIKKLTSKIDSLEQRLAAPTKADEPDFVPETLPADLQEAVDDIPDLLTWQTSKAYQDHWQLAKSTDAMLLRHPTWKAKPEAERLQEVARRVKADLGAPAPTPPAPAAARAAQRITNAPERGIETLSDLRGGVAPSAKQGDDFYSMKSDEEVMGALARLG